MPISGEDYNIKSHGFGLYLKVRLVNKPPKCDIRLAMQAYVQKSLFRAFVNGSFAPLTFLTRFTIILFRLMLFDEQYESSQSSCLLSNVLTRCRKRVPTDFVSVSQTGHLQAIMVLPLIQIIHWGMTSINAIKS